MLARLQWYLSAAHEYPGVHRVVREIEQESSLTPSQWRQRQFERLTAMLRFAGRHVPYYRGVLNRMDAEADRLDSPDQFAKLPLLTRRNVADHQAGLVAEGVDYGRLFKNATGGSTGTPLTFYQDQNYLTTAAALDVCVRRWWGIQPYDRTASIWGADREFSELSNRERLYQWRHRVRTMNAFRMDAGSLRRFCLMLARWEPAYLTGYATALETLARFVEKENLEGMQFRAVRSAAEMLWPHQRDRIERVLRSPVYNFYGSREINNLAAECPEQRRLHLISTWRYLEIVDEHGQPLPSGMPGYIVVTDMSNCAMPFIRYRNDDMAVLAAEPCPCGRPSPVIEKLLGRTSDIVHSPRGEWIHGEYFTHLFYDHPEIRQFQVHQTELDRIVIRYVPAREGCETALQAIAQKLRQRMGAEVRIELHQCDQIRVGASGKYRFTLSDVHPPLAELSAMRGSA